MVRGGLEEFMQHLNMTLGFELSSEEDQLGESEDDGTQYLSITVIVMMVVMGTKRFLRKASMHLR